MPDKLQELQRDAAAGGCGSQKMGSVQYMLVIF